MKKNRLLALIAFASLGLSAIAGNPAASAQGSATAASSPSATEMGQVEEELAALQDLLEAHKIEHQQAPNGETTYTLAPGIKLTYGSGPSSVHPQVGGGWDPWPYFEFDSSEQQALISGSAATLAGAICAIAGPESAGVGCAVGGGIVLTIVGIATAHGACPNNQTMRVYPLLGVAGASCH